ncbi:MAG TPA: DUF4124 domain-containing protein [Nitrospirota bacterium]|jgi:hypothetical protein|nr:DUF4124 domain-containing protein [Nitrospirota bacterium]
MLRCVVLAACVFFIAATSAHAEFYRWVDKDGKEFFTNELEKVPQEYRESVQTVKPDESRVSVGDRPSAVVKPGGLSGEHKDKNGRGEEYWRKKAANLRLKLRDQQDEYNFILKKLENQDQNPNQLAGKKSRSVSSLEKKKLKLEKEIAQTRRKLEVDLPEEARRADAYPGWIRE